MRKIVTVGAFIFFAVTPVIGQAEPNRWNSVQECYSAHIRLADGAYPLQGDDPAELMDHCRRMVEKSKCNFACLATQVPWEFAVKAPASQREARVRGFFEKSKAPPPCGLFTKLFGECEK